MIGVNVVAADTDDEAQRLLTSLQQAFVNLRSGRPTPLPPPVDDFASAARPAAGGAARRRAGLRRDRLAGDGARAACAAWSRRPAPTS